MNQFGRIVIFVVVCLTSVAVFAKDQKLTPQEVIQKSLDTIGTKEARAAANARQLTGRVRLKQLAGGGHVDLDGLVSFMTIAPNQTRLQMKFNVPTYSGEDFIFRGEKVEVAYSQPGIRSSLGNFIFDRELMLREGLLGGPLSAATPLEDLAAHQAKVTYDGLKKVGGVQLHQISYFPKKNPDEVKIKLFFDENFRHVMTLYSWVTSMGLGQSDVETAQMRVTHYDLQEVFSDFRPIGNLTLPTFYTLRLNSDADNRTDNKTYTYEMSFDRYNKAAIPANAGATPAK